MWDSLVGAVSGAATAVGTGLLGTGEKVPFSCQVPFKKFDEKMTDADNLAQLFHSECETLRSSPKWTDMAFSDPDGGDMQAFTQDQVGCYHFVKVKFTIKAARNTEVFGKLTSDKKEVRAQFSKDLAELEYLAEKGSCGLLRIAYTAPAAAAGRDFVFLCSEKLGGDKLEAWGCSVDVASRPEDYEGYVRGACLYHWEVTQKGEDVFCQYTSCFDPRGWAPPFIISWFKSSATDEFRALRKICSKAAARPVAQVDPNAAA